MSQEKINALTSVKTARGQLDGIIRMIEDDRYCLDISNQIIAAQGLLKKTNLLILKQYIEHCILQAINGDNENEKNIEIIDILEKIVHDKF